MERVPRMDKIINDAKAEVGVFGSRSKSNTPSTSGLAMLRPQSDIEDFLAKNTPSYVRPIYDTKKAT